MAEYIKREDVSQVLQGIANGLLVGETEALKAKDMKSLLKIKAAKEILKTVDNDLCFIPTADVQPVIETEDLATATEQFICKNCGIRIENFDKVVLEEDNDGYINKLFYEYIFKFCPECGAEVKDGDTK